jgi:hypothetical protein
VPSPTFLLQNIYSDHPGKPPGRCWDQQEELFLFPCAGVSLISKPLAAWAEINMPAAMLNPPLPCRRPSHPPL